MKTTGKILLMLSSVILASCMAAEPETNHDNMIPVVVGKVTDENGTAIEHIKVTLRWNVHPSPTEAYTSSEGIFRSEAYINPEGSTTLEVTLEDIDGEENGGMFEPLEDTVTLFPEDTDPEEGIRFDLAYRLNRATPSESTPQS